MHPLARPGNNTNIGRDDVGGSQIQAGERVILTDGRRGVADQFNNDGSAYLSLDDGNCITVAWGQVSKEAHPPENVTELLTDDIKWPTDFRWENGEYVRTREPYQ